MKKLLLIFMLACTLLFSACEQGPLTETKFPTEEAMPRSDALTVYSLYPSPFIREITKATLSEYIVGTQDGISAKDAIRLLTTQLLAGSGPDVIVLDGLPIESYIDKGALAEISDVLPDAIFQNIRTAFEGKDGSIYAMPSRFKVPAFMGENAEGINSVTQFTDWLEQRERPFLMNDPSLLVQDFYTVYANRWTTSEGLLNETAFRQDLDAILRIQTLCKGADIPYFKDWGIDTGIWLGVCEVHANQYATQLGSLNSVYGLPLSFSFAAAGINTAIQPLGDDLFIPYGILCINKRSEKMDMAKDFLRKCFALDAQILDIGNGISHYESPGFPVNEKALEVQMRMLTVDGYIKEWAPSGPEDIQYRDWETVITKIPTQRELDALLKHLRSLTLPAQADHSLRDIFVAEAQGYLDGNKSMDDTLRDLKTKLSLYGME